MNKVYCGDCDKETNHKVLFEHVVQADADCPVGFRYAWQVIECLGCDFVSFRKETQDEDDIDPETGKAEPKEQVFPQRSNRSPKFHWFDDHLIPSRIKRVYDEVIAAINNSSVILAPLGLRTLIEAICIEHGVPGDSLAKKIEALGRQGVLSVSQSAILHKLRYLGNDATHDAQPATQIEIHAGLDIAETILKTIYILPDLSKQFRERPPRNKKDG